MTNLSKPLSLSEVADRLYLDRSNYKKVSLKEKDSNFFIINRYTLKKYTDICIKLNVKNIDKSLAMDILFLESKADPYYKNWLWKNNKIDKNKSKYTKAEINLLIELLDLKDVDDINRLDKIDSKYISEVLKQHKKENGK